MLRTSLGDGHAVRDAQRVYEAWNGESRVYLLPDLRKIYRWRDAHHHVGALAIPAECYDVVDVLHVDSRGHVVGPASAWLFPNGVDGFLSRVVAALDQERVSTVSPPPPRAIRLMVPMVRKGHVVVRKGNAVLEWVELPFQPGPLVPFTSINRRTMRVTATWPPSGTSVRSISPEAESEARYGPLRWETLDGKRIAVSVRDPTRTGLWMQLRFPQPLERFFRSDPGLDDATAVLDARAIRRLASRDRARALDKARAAAVPYVGTGTVPAERLYFAQAEARGGLDAVWLLAQDWGLPYPARRRPKRSRLRADHPNGRRP